MIASAPAPTPGLAIEAVGLGKRFAATVAVDGLELAVAAGSCFGLLGPNGAGKSTTIQMLATLVRPDHGRAWIAGRDVAREPVAARAALGLVFQEPALDRSLSMFENLRLAGALHGLPRREVEARGVPLLRGFGIEAKRDAPAASLSGGQRRLLDIARALLHRPRVLILDEPTAGLDPDNRRALWRCLAQLRAADGVTVLVSTHLLDEAAGCDRVAFLRDGRLAGEGAPGELVAGLGAQLLTVRGPGSAAGAGAGDAAGDALAALARRFGPGLAERDATCFRIPDAGFALAQLDAALLAPFAAVELRRPTLDDVYRWLNRADAATVPAAATEPR